jgi:hypothetical protein
MVYYIISKGTLVEPADFTGSLWMGLGKFYPCKYYKT